MTDTGSVPASKGLFRTPLACALLSGALAVAAAQIFEWAFIPTGVVDTPNRYLYTQKLISILRIPQLWLKFALMLHGPVFFYRQWSRSGKAVSFALAILILTALTSLLVMQNALVQGVVAGVVRGSLIGVFQAVLYRCHTKVGLCSVLGILGAVPSIALSVFTRYGSPGTSREWIAFSFMLTLLVTIVQVVLPTLPIDRALRTAAPKQVVEHE